jgi:hypothetical protein
MAAEPKKTEKARGFVFPKQLRSLTAQQLNSRKTAAS